MIEQKNSNTIKVLLERYIQNSRHIEVQILGDQHGNYVHLFERDCSIQRRHQKVIEEAPSSFSEQLRSEIGEKAKAAAKAVNYCNAGTVEFIFDVDTKEFFFMEMNTRLQVEHPITEMITGVDLVEHQLRIAAGEQLSLTQESLRFKKIKHIVQEERAFHRGNGKLEFYKEPVAVDGKVRLESGVREGDEISIFYDPMIAKLVVWGETREEAIRTMTSSLRAYRIIGLPNNINFLRRIVEHPEFQTHDYDTSFIPKNKADLLKLKPRFTHEDIAFGIALKLINKQKELSAPRSLINFRNGLNLSTLYSIEVTSDAYSEKFAEDVQVTAKPYNAFEFQFMDGHKISIESIKNLGNHRFSIITSKSTIEKECSFSLTDVHIFDEDGDPIKIILVNDIMQKSEVKAHESNVITAPMPCTLTKVTVKVGDKVTKGQLLIVTEAMKMEHTIKAPMDGIVKEIKYREGQFIEAGSIILKIE